MQRAISVKKCVYVSVSPVISCLGFVYKSLIILILKKQQQICRINFVIHVLLTAFNRYDRSSYDNHTQNKFTFVTKQSTSRTMTIYLHSNTRQRGYLCHERALTEPKSNMAAEQYQAGNTVPITCKTVRETGISRHHRGRL